MTSKTCVRSKNNRKHHKHKSMLAYMCNTPRKQTTHRKPPILATNNTTKNLVVTQTIILAQSTSAYG